MTTISNPPIAEWRMYIDGKLVPSSSGKTFDNISPSTEEVIGVTADGTREDFEQAIAAARRAFDTTDWAANSALRARCLTQLYEALERHKDEVRATVVDEVGTCVWLTGDTLLDVPIQRVADYARMALEYPYETELPELDFRGMVSRRIQRKEAMGVVAAIVPWNAPWGSALPKIAAALGAGNTVVFKPSPDAPWAATILGRLAAEETDFPPGVLNCVTSSDNLMGEVLTTDPRVDMIAMTGSAANGKRIAEVAAKTLKRLLLELGGKSAWVVLESADVAKEAATAAKMICGNAGQGCVARSRLLVPQARYDEAVKAAKESMAQVTVGDPHDPKSFMGPLVSRHHRQRVMGYIDRAISDGNRLVHGGRIPPNLKKGFYVEPTLFADVKPKDTIAQEEIFGPVLAIIPYKDEDDAAAIANDSIYGLSASVSAATDQEALKFANRLRTGTVSVNGGVWMNQDVPFGGYKQSGIGRLFGVAGFEECLETKVIGVPAHKPAKSPAWGDAAE